MYCQNLCKNLLLQTFLSLYNWSLKSCSVKIYTGTHFYRLFLSLYNDWSLKSCSAKIYARTHFYRLFSPFIMANSIQSTQQNKTTFTSCTFYAIRETESVSEKAVVSLSHKRQWEKSNVPFTVHKFDILQTFVTVRIAKLSHWIAIIIFLEAGVQNHFGLAVWRHNAVLNGRNGSFFLRPSSYTTGTVLVYRSFRDSWALDSVAS